MAASVPNGGAGNGNGGPDSVAERVLAVDAPWKLIQKNCFTRWINEYLKVVNKQIADLETDLSDGLRLISLVEVLSGKEITQKYTKRPAFRSQKLENITLALKFLEKEERIRIVNIDSTDIVDSKLKLILGLIWTLILHYSMTIPVWDDGDDDNLDAKIRQQQTPKQRLLAWIQNKVPDRSITNFTTDWNDGLAIGALVDGIAPGLCPDWEDWDPANCRQNATEAMNAAERWLDVPQLVRPDEMCDPMVDELSMMTYLSQFPNAKLKEGAPLRPRISPRKVRVYGPGVEPTGNTAESVAEFTVETFSAGRGDVAVVVCNSDNEPQPCDLVFNNDKHLTYTCRYQPSIPGLYTVAVTFAGRHVPKSPFKVEIEPAIPQPSVDALNNRTVTPEPCRRPICIEKVQCSFRSDVESVRVGDEVTFDVDSSEADHVQPDVTATGPNGVVCEVDSKRVDAGLFQYRFYPTVKGLWKIDVKVDDESVPKSPFRVNVLPKYEPDKVRVDGDGATTEADVVMVNVPTSFIVDTTYAGTAQLHVDIKDCEGNVIHPEIERRSSTVSQVTYTSKCAGSCTVSVLYGNYHVPQSPFIVPVHEPQLQAVDEVDMTSLQCAPDGIVDDSLLTNEELITGYRPVDFCIPVGPVLNFVTAVVRGPSGTESCPEICDRHDGTISVRCKPTETGLHLLDVMYNDQSIDGSPFQFYAQPFECKKIAAHGPGLSHGVATTQCRFNIDTGVDCPVGSLSVAIEGPSKTEIQCSANEDNRSCTVCYCPQVAGKYCISIQYNDVHIDGSPFVASILPTDDDQKRSFATVAGDAVVRCLTDQPIAFNVDDLDATIVGPSGQPYTQFKLAVLHNGRLGVVFSPKQVGKYEVAVYHKDYGQIIGSPFTVHISQPDIADLDKVKVYGNGLSEGQINEPCQFYIETVDAGCGPVSVSIEGAGQVETDCTDAGDGKFCVTYNATVPGVYVINVHMAGMLVPGCPYFATVVGTSTVYDERDIAQQVIETSTEPYVGTECELAVKLPGSDVMDIRATVLCPSGVSGQCQVTANGNPGVYHVTFLPHENGQHLITILNNGSPVPGSPFSFTVGPVSNGDASKVIAVGEGLNSATVDEQGQFVIYTHEAGLGRLSVAMEGPSRCDMNMHDLGNGTCEVNYTCSNPGFYLLSVKFDDVHIPRSPFKVEVLSSPTAVADVSNTRQVHNVGCQVNKPVAVSFDVVDQHSVDQLEAYVVAPSGCQHETVIQQLHKDRYSVRFVPRENGVHIIHIKRDKHPITGSPFKVIVGNMSGDAAMVHACGPGLSHGFTGDKCKFIVDTEKAGSGALAVTVDGPSKVHLECHQLKTGGYQFGYCPTVAGEYVVSITYSGHSHIPGSPFKVLIQGKPQTTTTMSITETSGKHSLIRCFGNGLVSANMNCEATFTINTSNLSRSMLLVGVMGPSGPCEHVSVRHTIDGQYAVVYKPTEPGSFVIVVKYDDMHVSGSPFRVAVQ